jgi:hyperosmotically inducible protein
MTNTGQRIALSLLLVGGAAACSTDSRQPVESPRSSTAFSGAEAEDNYGDTTAVRDTTHNITPVVPSNDLPGEPGQRGPVAGDQLASDVPGVLPTDMPPPPVGRIDQPLSEPAADKPATKPQAGDAIAADDSNIKRDGKGRPLTASDQGTSKRDLEITKRIRESVLDNDQLSFTAKNVKIITVDGRVTLRGPVRNQAERREIEKAALAIAGDGQVSNHIEVR